MSYILDALRKADAERERGAVPGIHAQPLAAGLPLAPASRTGGFGGSDGSRRWLIGAATGALALVLAIAVWRMTATDTAGLSAPLASAERADPPPARPSPATLPAPEPSAAVPPAVFTDVPPSTRAALPPTAGMPSRRTDPATPLARSAAATATPRRPAVASPAEPSPPAADPSSTARMPQTAAAGPLSAAADVTSPAAADSRIYQIRELPDDVRRELPALTVGGATYSENPASRMLIINGQVFHENDKLAPELVLERIQLRSAVLRYKGLRYAIAY